MLINVTYNANEALQGVLWAASWGGWLTLRDVSALTPGAPPTPVDGEVVLHVDKIAYLQVIAP